MPRSFFGPLLLLLSILAYGLPFTTTRYYYPSGVSKTRKSVFIPSTGLLKPVHVLSSSTSSSSEETNTQLKAEALELLDCLTSPRDQDDHEYDFDKDSRRDDLLAMNDYQTLKLELRSRGLPTSGDKTEMITRLLLNIIDPSINYNEMTGREVRLQYIDEEDVKSNKVKIVPEEQRLSEAEYDAGPDSEDLQVLRKKYFVSSQRNVVGGKSSPGPVGSSVTKNKMRSLDKEKIVMDGLTRREVDFAPLRISRAQTAASKEEDKDASIKAYVVGGRDVLKTWEKTSAVVVLLPDEAGWRDKSIRILADEISFYNQAIVVVPDLYRGNTWTEGRNAKYVPVQQTTTATSASSATSTGAGTTSTGTASSTASTTKDNETGIDIRGENNSSPSSSSSATAAKLSIYDKQQDIRDYSPDYNEWLQSHSYDRVFDDIIATLRFSKLQYDSKAVSLAGVGCGGGWALQAACDLSDIRCAAAVGLGGVDDKVKQAAAAGATVRALSSTMDGKPRTLKLSPNERKPVNLFLKESEFKKAADAMLSEVQGLEGLDELFEESESSSTAAADVEEGKNRLEEALLERAAATTAGNDDHDSTSTDTGNKNKTNKKKVVSNDFLYEQMELKLKNLQVEAEEHDVSIAESRAQRGASLIAEYATVPLGEVALLEPCAVLAFSPSLRVSSDSRDMMTTRAVDAAVKKEVDRIAKSLSVPAFIVFGESDSSPGASIKSAEQMFSVLSGRLSEIPDLSIRVYEGRKEGFIVAPQNDDDAKCAQEATVVGAIWLDVFSRSSEDRTDGVGLTKLSDPFSFVPVRDMVHPVQGSPVATYLHDDPDFVRNERLTT